MITPPRVQESTGTPHTCKLPKPLCPKRYLGMHVHYHPWTCERDHPPKPHLPYLPPTGTKLDRKEGRAQQRTEDVPAHKGKPWQRRLIKEPQGMQKEVGHTLLLNN